MVLATQVQNFELSPEEEEGAKTPKWDPSVLPPILLSTMLLSLCPSSYITVETSSLHQPVCFLYSLITSLTFLVCSSLHPYLLWFSVILVKKEVERWLWEGKFGRGSGDVLLGGVSSPLACREEERWGWAVDVGASLIKRKAEKWEGTCTLELDSCYARRGARGGKCIYARRGVRHVCCCDFHFSSVASVLSAAAGAFRLITCSKSAAKWVSWDKTLKHLLKDHKFFKTHRENSKQTVELAFGFYF